MIDIEPRKLSNCRRSGSRFGVLYLSRSTFLSSVPTLLTRRRALACGVVVGAGERRGAAGGVGGCLSRVDFHRKACSRTPRRNWPPVTYGLGRRVCHRKMLPVSVEVSPWTGGWSKHRHRTRCDGRQMVLAGLVN
jgi:hypothetical protein